MTRATKLTLLTSLIVTAFALGMFFEAHTSQRVAFSDADNHWDHSGSDIFTVPANARVGINTSAPESQLHADMSGANLAATFGEFRDADASAPFFVLRKAKGSQGAPASVATGGTLGTFAFRGWDGNGDYIDAARIVALAEGTVGDNRVPGRLLFQTASDAPSSPLAERMRIDSAGNVGIGTTTPGRTLDVAGTVRSTSGGFEFPDGTVQTQAFPPTADGSNLAVDFTEFRDADASAPFFVLRKAKGSLAVPASVASGGALGTFAFRGWDGNGDYIDAARIAAQAEGTVGDDRVPGRLLFQTAGDAPSSPLAERMRIDSSGNVGIGTTSPSQKLHVEGNINLTGGGTQTITSDGELCIGSGCP